MEAPRRQIRPRPRRIRPRRRQIRPDPAEGFNPIPEVDEEEQGSPRRTLPVAPRPAPRAEQRREPRMERRRAPHSGEGRASEGGRTARHRRPGEREGKRKEEGSENERWLIQG